MALALTAGAGQDKRAPTFLGVVGIQRRTDGRPPPLPEAGERLLCPAAPLNVDKFYPFALAM